VAAPVRGCYRERMQLARLVGIAVGLMLVVAGARPAEACGFWRMTDVEKKFNIGWLINSGEISTSKGRRVAALYLDLEAAGGMTVATSKKVIFDVKDGKLRRYRRPVATIDSTAGTVTFGKRVYTIEFTEEKKLHDMPSWTVAVKRGAELVIESSDASALCAIAAAAQHGIQMTIAEQQEEISRRIAFYLAWRELGF
jgi:hypothetical protein